MLYDLRLFMFNQRLLHTHLKTGYRLKMISCSDLEYICDIVKKRDQLLQKNLRINHLLNC